MDRTSLLVTLVVKHTEVAKSTMDKGDDSKLAYMSDVCDRIMARLELLRKQSPDPDGKDNKYIAARLAEHIHVTEATISGWKKGTIKWPRPRHLCLAAQYLLTTEWWLAFGKNDPRCDAKGNLKKDPKIGPLPPPYPYPPETLRLIEAAEPLDHEDRRRLQSVAYALAHKCASWDGTERRRQP